MNRPAEASLSLLLWAAALPVFIAGCFIIWTGSFFLRGPRLEKLIKAVCRVVLLGCGVRVCLRGREHFDPGRQYIVMMNHVNFLDPLVLYAGFPGMARGVEEESHFRWPVYGPTIRRLGVIPISRKDTARAVESLKRAASWIRSRPGYSFVVLPEGTRTADGRLGPFKRGGFLLAVETGLPILPVVQTGAREINRKGSRIIRPGRVQMTMAPAVATAGRPREDVSRLVDEVRAVFLRLGGD